MDTLILDRLSLDRLESEGSNPIANLDIGLSYSNLGLFKIWGRPMENKDPLEDELGKYENKWVAILESEQKIVGSGDSAREAKIQAESNGYPEIALFKVPSLSRYYVYRLW
jgi:hypothetical protein